MSEIGDLVSLAIFWWTVLHRVAGEVGASMASGVGCCLLRGSGKTNVDFFFQVINTLNRSNTFRKTYSLGSPYNGLDDDGDWDKDLHDTNGNGEPDPGETNVDESDEGKIRERSISLFPILPTIGFTWEF